MSGLMLRRTLAPRGLLYAGCFVLTACGSGDPPPTGSALGVAPTSGNGTTTGDSASAGTAATPTGKVEDLGLALPAQGSGAADDGTFSECVGEVRAAEGVGLDMYVVFDRSGSMENEGAGTGGRGGGPGDCPLDIAGMPGNNSKWCLGTYALAQYFTSDFAANNRAALQYMPTEDPGDDPTVCTTGGSISQAEVPLSLLPAAATDPLILSLDASVPGQPSGGTPIEAALNGIATFTAANQEVGRVMIGVLITDGDPHNCQEDPAALGQIIANHLAATQIRTFIIGMDGATNANLETMAIEGGAPEHTDFCGTGTSPCHYWNVGAGDPAAFVSALEQIQQSAVLPCNYLIPTPPNGQTLDPGLVNVTFTDELGNPTPLGKVDDSAACAGVASGWYYDNNDAPTAIQLCPTTCSAAEAAASGANVDVSFGCATVVR